MIDTVLATDIEAAARAGLSWLVQSLLLGTILAAGTWALLRVLRRRISSGLEMALWCVVLLRFVLPAAPGWSGSLADLCGRILPPARAGAAEWESRPALPATGASLVTDQATVVVAPARTWRPGWATMVLAAYAAVPLTLAVVRWVAYRRFRGACLALPGADVRTRRVVEDVCRRVGLGRVPTIRISDDGRAPFVMGIVRPLLVLSRRQLVRPDELETVVVHEVTHLRRGDMVVRCLQCAAGALFFFWPVVAWVNRRINRTREYTCDEWALRHGKLTPGEYARCLFEAVRERRQARWAYAPACMAGHPSTIERRIDVILSHPNRPSRGSLARLAGAVFIIAWSGFTLAGAGEPAESVTPRYDNTEAGMRQHAQVLFDMINKVPGGDINGDGEVTKDECWAFVTAILRSQPEATLKAYPWADKNQDGKLDADEAFCLGRGDYDFEELYKTSGADQKKAEKEENPKKMQYLKQELVTQEYATWHVILDRRAKFVAEATPPPSPEFVRQVYETQIKPVLGQVAYDDCVRALRQVAQLKDKAHELRDKAAKASAGDQTELEAKAAQLEQEAAQLRLKLQQELESRLKEIEARGPAEHAAKYRDLLKKLESL